MKLSVKTLDAQDKGEIELDDSIFGIEPRRDILARVVNWQLAKRRAGTHKVKLIGDIRGTTARPYRQKGTGRARQGSVRSAQFRGGATVHGPVVRSHAHDLPKKVRRLGLKCALSAKQAEGKLIVLDSAEGSGKTKDLVKQLETLGWTSVLLIDGPEANASFLRACNNIPKIDVLPTQGANVYDILRRDILVLTRDAVEHLEARLK
ncbi:MAG: 50S ribosomal protein L4 [Alphaproteobacteria bacterium]|jgi:large subunit ribosomal protein L4|nr:50S ribosomal protein L4 [Alphaproteobacteria bacterium]